MMKVTLNTLLASADALTRLLAQPLPARASFKLSKVQKAVTTELNNYEEARVALVTKYGTKQGNVVQVSKDGPNWQQFTAEHAELVNTETELLIEPLPLSFIEQAMVTPADCLHLDWLIVDQEV